MDDFAEELERIQQVLVSRFKDYGRLYVVTKEILTVDEIDGEQKKVPPHRVGVIEDPHYSNGRFRTLFALNEPCRTGVSLVSRQRYKILGEGEITPKQREAARGIEDHLDMRVYNDDKDERSLPELCPHELRPYEGHPLVIGHKSGIFDGTVALRNWGAGIYIEIESPEGPKVFGVGGFIGGTVYIHGNLYRLTERKRRR